MLERTVHKGGQSGFLGGNYRLDLEHHCLKTRLNQKKDGTGIANDLGLLT